ncbi:hypothetical protein CR513_00856, partial [Mucuna pruriens]
MSFLQEIDFQDIFLNEVPRIEHHIDLIPRVALPNRPIYRSKSNETKEIQKQVNNLLSKGYVRESMSPCVVTILLVPKNDGT